MTRDSADAYIRANYGKQTAPVIAAHLGEGRSAAYVRVRAQRIGIAKRRTKPAHPAPPTILKRAKPLPRHQWTPLQRRQLDELREMGETYRTIAREIGVAPVHVLREIERRAERPQPIVPPRRQPVEPEARWSLEVIIETSIERRRAAAGPTGIRCACGRPGAPVHCAEHGPLVGRRVAA